MLGRKKFIKSRSELTLIDGEGGLGRENGARQEGARNRIRVLLDANEEAMAKTAFLEFLQSQCESGVFRLERAGIEKALKVQPVKLSSLLRLEETGGDVRLLMVDGDGYLFADFSSESPRGRRWLTYKEAEGQAKEFGVELMDEECYRLLQGLRQCDVAYSRDDSWTWLKTSPKTLATGLAYYGYNWGGCRVSWRDAQAPTEDGGWRGMLRVKKVLF